MAYLKKHNYRVISLSDLVSCLETKTDLPKKAVVLTFDDGYQDNYFNVWPILKKYNFAATIFLVPGLIGQEMNNAQKIPLKILDWPQIQEMHQSGLVDFQPHSLTHPRLDKISLEQVRKEIKESRKIIEERLNKTCSFFAYPFGKYNEEVKQIVKKEGFKAALSIKAGLVKEGDDVFELNRISVNSRISLVRFRAKLKGLILPKKWVKRIYG